MEELLKLNREDVEPRIRKEFVLSTAIIQAAITFFPLLFLAVILAFPVLNPEIGKDESLDPQMAMLLLQVLGLICLVAIVVGVYLPSFLLKPASLHARAEQQLASGSDPVTWMCNIYRTSVIIRLAFLEGAALCGLMPPLMASLGGYLDDNPVFWLGAIPLAIHVIAGVVTFPTRTSIANHLVTRILRPIKQSAA